MRADIGDLPDHFDTNVEVRALEEILEFRYGVGPGLGDFPNILGSQVLRRQH